MSEKDELSSPLASCVGIAIMVLGIVSWRGQDLVLMCMRMEMCIEATGFMVFNMVSHHC